MFTVAILAIYLIANATNADLVGYWRLDEQSGKAATDLSGNGNNGILNGDATWQSSSDLVDNALYLDGNNDYVSLPAPNLNTNTMTISAWIKREGDQNKAGIVFCRAGNTVAGLSFNTGNRLRYHWNDSPKTYRWDSGLVVPDDQWVHVALVVEPTKATIYLNQKGTISSSTHVLEHLAEEFDGAVLIGSDNFEGGRFFNGLIRNVIIFDHALNETEIAQLFDLKSAPLIPKPLQTLLSAIKEAKQNLKMQRYQETVDLIEKKLAECEEWRKKNPNDIGLGYEILFSDLHFLLAKAKEGAGFPKQDIATAYKRAVLSFQNSGLALVWLFENMPTEDFRDVVKKRVLNDDDAYRNVYYVTANLELSGNWDAFELFLDTVFSEVEDTVSYAEVIAESLNKNDVFAKKFLQYSRSKPQLLDYFIELYENLAQEYIKKARFLEAAEIYGAIMDKCTGEQDRAIYEFKNCQYTFQGGQYDRAIDKLNSFINHTKATNRKLIKKAIMLKGQSYINLGDINQAIDTFFVLLLEYPEAKQGPQANFFIGYCYMLQGKFDEATEALNLVVWDYPESSYVSKARSCLARIKSIIEEE